MAPIELNVSKMRMQFDPSERGAGSSNVYVERLIESGEPVSIPEDFLREHTLNRDGHPLGVPHQVHGLPKISGEAKVEISKWIADGLMTGDNIHFVLVDADNLKQANDEYKPGRHLGDAILHWLAAKPIDLLVNDPRFSQSLLPNTMCFATGDSPDEIVFIIRTNTSIGGEVDQFVEAINKARAEVKAQKTSDESEVDYCFSMSASAVKADSSLMSGLGEGLTTKSSAGSLTIDDAIHCFDEILTAADHACKIAKIRKDLENHQNQIGAMVTGEITLNDLLESVENTFGNSRISRPLLHLLNQLIAVISARSIIMIDEQTGNTILSKIEITREELLTIKSVDQMISLFDRLYCVAQSELKEDP